MPIDKTIKKAIGVFDSGLGGLTVVKELMRQLPFENIVYFGDTARVPYGTKSKQSIIKFSKENTEILLKNNVKIVVVACNSSSSYAIPALKRDFDVPILGVISPGAKKAVEVTKNKRVGVIATSATVASRKYHKMIKKYNKTVKVFAQPCPLFVPLVEEGWTDKKITEDIAGEYLSALKKDKIDTLILGCTHYPLLKKLLQRVMGNKVFLIDSAKEVAAAVKVTLEKLGIKRKASCKAKYKFLVSDKPQNFDRIANNFLGHKIKSIIRR